MSEKQNELTKKQSFLIGLSNFLQKNRIVFIVIIIVLVVGLIAFTVARETINNRIENSTMIAEEAQEAFQNWSSEIDDEKKSELEKEITALTEDILEKYPKHYAAQRAYFINANILFEKEEWAEAAALYEELQSNFPESYLAPIALNNASVSYEQNGDAGQAVEVLQKLAENYKDSFPDIEKTFFSIGRLSEAVEKYDDAGAAYNTLVDEYPASNWTKLARNRIIALKVSGEIDAE